MAKQRAYDKWAWKNSVAQSLWLKYYALVIKLGGAKSNTYSPEKIKKLNKQKDDTYDDYQDAVNERSDAWDDYVEVVEAYDNCKDNAYRDCDNDGREDDCQTAHTQSVSTCECHCGPGKYGCECGSCSTSYNN